MGNTPWKTGALKQGHATEALAVVPESTSRRRMERNAVRLTLNGSYRFYNSSKAANGASRSVAAVVTL